MKETQFKAGNSGRPPGSRNKVQSDIREKITQFISTNLKGMQAEYDQLEAKDRLAFLEKLLNFSVPKLQAVSSTISFEDMTEEQLDQIIARLKNE